MAAKETAESVKNALEGSYSDHIQKLLEIAAAAVRSAPGEIRLAYDEDGVSDHHDGSGGHAVKIVDESGRGFRMGYELEWYQLGPGRLGASLLNFAAGVVRPFERVRPSAHASLAAGTLEYGAKICSDQELADLRRILGASGAANMAD